MSDQTKTLTLYRKNPILQIIGYTIFLSFPFSFMFTKFNSAPEQIFYYVFISILGIFAIFLYRNLIGEYISYKKEIPVIYIENDILYIGNTIWSCKHKIPLFQIKEVEIISEINHKTVRNMIRIKYYPGVVPQTVFIHDLYHIDIDTILKRLQDAIH